jgi:GNAT superfamily N-acetyltransferase
MARWPSTTRTNFEDIRLCSYFVIKSNNIIVGGLAVLDYEADYEQLLEGKWLQDGPYLVIHRFAIFSSERGKGRASFALKQVEIMAKKRNINAIRVDTHEKNKPMINVLLKNGYLQIGVVLLGNFKRRLAFEKRL